MSFELDLKKFADKAGLNVETVVKKVGLEVLKSVIEKSPVDSGRFRSNWNLAINSKDTSTSESTANDAAVRGGAVLVSFKSGSINITNALPYGQRLEDGYSKQAPAGMIGLTVIEWKSYLNKAISELK